jgi:dihydroorotase
MCVLLLFLFGVILLNAQQRYDVLLVNGRVIDPKNGIDGPRDVAIANGKIALVGEGISPTQAKKTIDVRGLYVTPGLVDIHAHVFPRHREVSKYALSVQPDVLSFRTGVTTLVDAGSAGWREFPDFRDRIIKTARTRVLAFLNIVGSGIGGGREDDPADMDPAAAAKTAGQNSDLIVGFKSAHYAGKGWESIDASVKAGNLTNLTVMVDFGRINEVRNLRTLLEDKLRKGDIYTHCYSGHREELLENGTINPAMAAGRKRGIYFDVGHGAGSFYWYVAIPAYGQGFYPDSISTDLHADSMNAGMKDMPNIMSKHLRLGSSLQDVVARQPGRWRRGGYRGPSDR